MLVQTEIYFKIVVQTLNIIYIRTMSTKNQTLSQFARSVGVSLALVSQWKKDGKIKVVEVAPGAFVVPAGTMRPVAKHKGGRTGPRGGV